MSNVGQFVYGWESIAFSIAGLLSAFGISDSC